MNRSGLTLLEILVSMVILALIAAGLASTFVSAKRLLIHSRGKMTASEAAKFYLDSLHTEVSAVNWNNNCLGSNTGCNTTAITESNINMNYTPAWNITNQTDLNTLRKVKLTINWTERSAE